MFGRRTGKTKNTRHLIVVRGRDSFRISGGTGILTLAKPFMADGQTGGYEPRQRRAGFKDTCRQDNVHPLFGLGLDIVTGDDICSSPLSSGAIIATKCGGVSQGHEYEQRQQR